MQTDFIHMLKESQLEKEIEALDDALFDLASNDVHRTNLDRYLRVFKQKVDKKNQLEALDN